MKRQMFFIHLEDVKRPFLDEEKVLVKGHAAYIKAGDYLWSGWMRATTFCIGPDAFIGRVNYECRESFTFTVVSTTHKKL